MSIFPDEMSNSPCRNFKPANIEIAVQALLVIPKSIVYTGTVLREKDIQLSFDAELFQCCSLFA